MLRIKSFRIKNYKSISDSGECYVEEGVTILAGRNESGKTSILEALEDFDVERHIREDAKPIGMSEALPEIALTFTADKESINEIFGKMEVERSVSGNIELRIVKSFPDKYRITEETAKRAKVSFESEVVERLALARASLNQIQKLLKKLSGTLQPLPELTLKVPKSDLAIFNKYKLITQIPLSTLANTPDKDLLLAALESFPNLLTDLEWATQLDSVFLEHLTSRWVPNFILFSSFEDVFPNKIPYAELTTNQWIKDLSVVSDLDVDVIQNAIDREKHRHKTDVNLRLNKDYEKFWTQDLTRLSVDWDSQNLQFWIMEDGYPFEPSLRSKGRQWHLAFYVKVSARAREGVPNVILIDEPGLFLHAKAQADILGNLEDCSKSTQIVFSTHSPYLLEADKLNRIRLIQRSRKRGTEVINRVHTATDKEALTPVLTAIGLDLKSGILNHSQMQNVVVEGPSDQYYLTAFKCLCNWKDINFVFGGGSGNMPIVGTILRGWGCDVIYLFDNDMGKKNGQQNLRNNWLVSKDLTLAVSEEVGTIEDLFDKRDFVSHILQDERIEFDCSNSEYLKKLRLNKVLIAKQFLERARAKGGLTLQQVTLKRLDALVGSIRKALRASKEPAQ
ncbi:MAG: AAA family ATPase [bacterium]|nr:AAA family ATPase [bacterium]